MHNYNYFYINLFSTFSFLWISIISANECFYFMGIFADVYRYKKKTEFEMAATLPSIGEIVPD